MYLTTEKKREIFKKYGKSDTNTGSTEGQIALFTFRNRKDYKLSEHTIPVSDYEHSVITSRTLARVVICSGICPTTSPSATAWSSSSEVILTDSP